MRLYRSGSGAILRNPVGGGIMAGDLGCCCCGDCNCETDAPTAAFSWTTSPDPEDENGCLLNLTDESTDGACGTIRKRFWSISIEGGAAVDIGEGPTLDYALDIYTDAVVTLRVYDGCCFDEVSHAVACPCGTVADFHATWTGTPCSFQFTDDSTATAGETIVEWSWDFGDGTTSTDQNPTHSYSGTSYHTVQLVATDSSGCSATVSKGVACCDWCLIPPPDEVTVISSGWPNSPGQFFCNPYPLNGTFVVAVTFDGYPNCAQVQGKACNPSTRKLVTGETVACDMCVYVQILYSRSLRRLSLFVTFGSEVGGTSIAGYGNYELILNDTDECPGGSHTLNRTSGSGPSTVQLSW